MKTINLGGREITIKGSPLTLLFYKQEFGQSFSGDLAAMQEIENDISKLDDVNLLQMIWAMEKTANGKIKPFYKWLEEFESLNIHEVIQDVFEVAVDATFRDSKKTNR